MSLGQNIAESFKPTSDSWKSLKKTMLQAPETLKSKYEECDKFFQQLDNVIKLLREASDKPQASQMAKMVTTAKQIQILLNSDYLYTIPEQINSLQDTNFTDDLHDEISKNIFQVKREISEFCSFIDKDIEINSDKCYMDKNPFEIVNEHLEVQFENDIEDDDNLTEYINTGEDTSHFIDELNHVDLADLYKNAAMNANAFCLDKLGDDALVTDVHSHLPESISKEAKANLGSLFYSFGESMKHKYQTAVSLQLYPKKSPMKTSRKNWIFIDRKNIYTKICVKSYDGDVKLQQSFPFHEAVPSFNKYPLNENQLNVFEKLNQDIGKLSQELYEEIWTKTNYDVNKINDLEQSFRDNLSKLQKDILKNSDKKSAHDCLQAINLCWDSYLLSKESARIIKRIPGDQASSPVIACESSGNFEISNDQYFDDRVYYPFLETAEYKNLDGLMTDLHGFFGKLKGQSPVPMSFDSDNYNNLSIAYRSDYLETVTQAFMSLEEIQNSNLNDENLEELIRNSFILKFYAEALAINTFDEKVDQMSIDDDKKLLEYEQIMSDISHNASILLDNLIIRYELLDRKDENISIDDLLKKEMDQNVKEGKIYSDTLSTKIHYDSIEDILHSNDQSLDNITEFTTKLEPVVRSFLVIARQKYILSSEDSTLKDPKGLKASLTNVRPSSDDELPVARVALVHEENNATLLRDLDPCYYPAEPVYFDALKNFTFGDANDDNTVRHNLLDENQIETLLKYTKELYLFMWDPELALDDRELLTIKKEDFNNDNDYKDELIQANKEMHKDKQDWFKETQDELRQLITQMQIDAKSKIKEIKIEDQHAVQTDNLIHQACMALELVWDAHTLSKELAMVLRRSSDQMPIEQMPEYFNRFAVELSYEKNQPFSQWLESEIDEQGFDDEEDLEGGAPVIDNPPDNGPSGPLYALTEKGYESVRRHAKEFEVPMWKNKNRISYPDPRQS